MKARTQMHWLLPIVLMGALACCAKKQPEKNVWELYDIRHPVPAGSQVPVSRASQYDRYRDNDEFYVPPSFGSCGSDNIGLGGCE